MHPNFRQLVLGLLAKSVRQDSVPEPILAILTQRCRDYAEKGEQLASDDFWSRIMRDDLYRIQQLLYQRGGDLHAVLEQIPKDAPLRLPDWEVMAHLFTLGEVAVATAKHFLPEELKLLAEQWKEAGEDAAKQIAVCEALQRALMHRQEDDDDAEEETPREERWIADHFDQDLSRILPLQFLGKDGRPNCLGKAIILCGFFNSVGVDVHGVTPITPYHDQAEAVLSSIAEQINEMAVQCGLGKPEKLEKAFKQREELARLRANTPERFHMGIVVPLCDNRFYLIDPHMRCSGVFGDTETMAMALSLVDLIFTMRPGIALLHSEGNAFHQLFYEAAMEAGKPIDAIKLALNRWDRINRHPLAAIPVLANSRALEILLEEKFYLSEDEAAKMLAAFRDEETAHYLRVQITKEGMEGVLNFKTSSGRELSPSEHNRCLIAALVLNFASGGKLFEAYRKKKEGGEQTPATSQGPHESAEVEEALAEGLKVCLGALFSMAFRRATKALRYGKNDISPPHPLVELYEPWFRIGVEIAAHANAIGDQDEATIMELAAVCGGQFHVALAAAEPLRTGEVSELSRAARELLQAFPARLRVAEAVLSQLAEQETSTTAAMTA